MANIIIGYNSFLFLCVTLLSFYSAFVLTQENSQRIKIPPTRFTCQGRAAGYYADLDTGCQVYHMCDGLGRQFSYTCPNTTLFQQRMLICDHWYMVNCSMSERDYKANLLIGQRDKPFVSDEEMGQRTPRPDILSVPLNNNYYDGLKEAEAKFPLHPGNSIVGIADSISIDEDNELDSAKQNYRPPSSWSTRKRRPEVDINANDIENVSGTASRELGPTARSITNNAVQNHRRLFNEPDRELSPPLQPTTTEATTEGEQISTTDSVYNFIKRFDPNSPDTIGTAITETEIINLNKNLPDAQVSSEEDRTPRKNKNFGSNNFNDFKTDNDKTFTEKARFDTVNIKANTEKPVVEEKNRIPQPEKVLLPPKTEYSQIPSTTMGPPIYYEWRWAVPAFGLEPPKESNDTNTTNNQQTRSVGTNPFSAVTRFTIADEDATPKPRNVEYNISSYLVPDYVFPLDKPHPGYDNDDAQTSFQVEVSRPGRSSYGENPECPECHPAYLKPGTCEPCIVKR